MSLASNDAGWRSVNDTVVAGYVSQVAARGGDNRLGLPFMSPRACGLVSSVENVLRRGALPVVFSAFLLSCYSGISESDLVCEQTGKIVSDREHIISALDRHFEADEILRKEFPAGTRPGRYSQLSYGATAEQNAEDQAKSIGDAAEQEVRNAQGAGKPPFVPAHFRSFKARVQRDYPAASKMQIVTAYMTQYPQCCRALSPRWLREGGWRGNLEYAPASQSGVSGRWIKDVWVIDDDMENAGRMWLNEGAYSTSQLDLDPSLKRFLFDEIFQKGDTASTQCGESFYVNR